MRIGGIAGLLACSVSACSKPPVGSYTMILVQDSGKRTDNLSAEEPSAQLSIGGLKAAKMALENFNAATDINNLTLNLEVLDLSLNEIDSQGALQTYVSQLQRNTPSRTATPSVEGHPQRSLVVGFVMQNANTEALQQFRQLVDSGDQSQVLVGTWPDGLPSSPEVGVMLLNIVKPMYEANAYLLKFAREQRELETLYVVSDNSRQAEARDFLMRARAANTAELVALQWVDGGRSNYREGSIRELSDLLRELRAKVLRSKQRSGVVLFLNQRHTEQSNRYLARSPYRYFFDRLDFILNSKTLELEALSAPNVATYFVVKQRRDEAERQALLKFRNSYQKNYHLHASREAAELFDAVSLLAYAAKKTIEASDDEKRLPALLYDELLRQQFSGVTGCLIFNADGQCLADYQVLQWEKEPQLLGYFSAGNGGFVAD